MNKSLFKSFMVRHEETQADVAALLGISVSRVNAKINGNGAQFTQSEIMTLKSHYLLTAEDVDRIFFAS